MTKVEPGLPALADRMETSMSRRAALTGGPDPGERFVTAVFAEIRADDGVVRIVNCGHPPRCSSGRTGSANSPGGRSAPPLNLGMLVGDPYHVEAYAFRPGDQLPLYTDGVTETREPDGSFHPRHRRLRSWGKPPPDELLRRPRTDLLAHSHDRLQDDIAALTACLLADEECAQRGGAALDRLSRTTDSYGVVT
ncbi:PP2C family protein-serine/threonine phosphatase [Streptomyces sp. ID05-04B]|uniref:PP2C family protein-serine/threonine phosphatase n=1 Tax=Streptomyces sp. ID05-04B TaxID=3028661 RepID=UPI0039F6AB1B